MSCLDGCKLLSLIWIIGCGIRVGNSGDPEAGQLRIDLVALKQAVKSVNLVFARVEATDQSGTRHVRDLAQKNVQFDRAGDKQNLLQGFGLPAGSYKELKVTLSESSGILVTSWNGQEKNVQLQHEGQEILLQQNFAVNSGLASELLLLLDFAAFSDEAVVAIPLAALNPRILPTTQVSTVEMPAKEGIAYGCLYKSAPAEVDAACEEAEDRVSVADGMLRFSYVSDGEYVVRFFFADGTYEDQVVAVPLEEGEAENAGGDEEVQPTDSDLTETERSEIRKVIEHSRRRALKNLDMFEYCAFRPSASAEDRQWLLDHEAEMHERITALEFSYLDGEPASCVDSSYSKAGAMRFFYLGCRDIWIYDGSELLFTKVLQDMGITNPVELANKAVYSRNVSPERCNK